MNMTRMIRDLPAGRAHLRPRCRRPAESKPGGLPPAALQAACDDLTGASVPPEFKHASRSLAVDWTDLESFSRPPPRGTSDCADPEASWGHRKNNLLRSQDELFYGYYLSAAISSRTTCCAAKTNCSTATTCPPRS